IVPVELALVQAANESAWGTSFFARRGNNYFGQWCFQKGCGIIPRRRRANAKHEVKYFNNAVESVHAYMKNINTLDSYAALRKIRRQLRLRHIPIYAEVLTRGLKNYSERGVEYLKILRHMIRSNRKLMLQTPPITR
ncbi:MAG: glucosaminidase domain-containing protein, partial [Mariprofundaceae bacterium]|nr:glucosaminidase domain-containing protein [Mariprofundaceae bacterium]